MARTVVITKQGIPGSAATGYSPGGTDVAVSDGGTGASSAAAARTNLGVPATTDLTSHTGNTSNPHSVTKAQVGLSNVDNTSDVNKPVSTAQRSALNLKAPAWVPAGASEVFPRWAFNFPVAPTAGKVYVMRLELETKAYTTLAFFVGTTGPSAVTNAWVGLYETTSGNRVAQNDVTTSINSATTNQFWTPSLSYSATAGDYWLAILIGGGSTIPTFWAGNSTSLASTAMASLAPAIAESHTSTGLTTLPASLTFGVSPSGVRLFWARYS